MANVLPSLDEGDRPLALYHGLVHVTADTAGQPPNFDLEPLETSEREPERYINWFRQFVELRSAQAAERTLRTAIRIGLDRKTIADMIFTACTDHLFLGVGHSARLRQQGFRATGPHRLGARRGGVARPDSQRQPGRGRQDGGDL